MKQTFTAIIIAALLWFMMFSPLTAPHLDFWLVMACSALILIALSAWLGKNFRSQFRFNIKDLAIGVVSAAVLWVIFYLGNYFSSLLFDFAKPQVADIYSLKNGMNPALLTALLLFLIGPAEELFWRGFVQRKFGERYGEWTALFAATAIYAMVHIWSFNFMLIMAAVVCGGFWGLLYKWNKNMLTLCVSHALWDVAAFVVFQIR
ncbi:MAG: CPBP family intramembrane metalloprotease [Dysgonamonadaceae bacterium]|jgi:membrane protease YdiL (CAAX protease family)|nr:CPBP family intramembrane metalloprotease [Dysgonamonadaceae bacterium]